MMRLDFAGVPEFVQQLKTEIKSDRRILSFSTVDDETLDAFERELDAVFQSKLKAEAIVSVAPTFVWWAAHGIWPENDRPGWRVLLRKIAVQGKQAVPRMRQ